MLVTPLSTTECQKHELGGATYQVNSRFFALLALTFFSSEISLNSTNSPQTAPKISVKNMHIIRYTQAPNIINHIACLNCFVKVCRLWANTATQLGDMLYNGECLSKLVSYVE